MQTLKDTKMNKNIMITIEKTEEENTIIIKKHNNFNMSKKVMSHKFSYK